MKKVHCKQEASKCKQKSRILDVVVPHPRSWSQGFQQFLKHGPCFQHWIAHFHWLCGGQRLKKRYLLGLPHMNKEVLTNSQDSLETVALIGPKAKQLLYLHGDSGRFNLKYAMIPWI